MKTFTWVSVVALPLVLVFSSCGGSSYNSGGGSGGGNAPSAPTGLAATAGNQQVALTWLASTTASSYHVKRATVSGGPYTQVANATVTNDTDAALTNGTKYFYVVSAVNAYGESANSSEASATPTGPAASVHVSVDALTDRHPISPYVYGGSYPKDPATITDSGLTVVRWGGNATSTYNWKLFTYNADNDFFFEDFTAQTWQPDSTQFITDVKAARSNTLMTMAMLPWVAKSPEVASPPNNHWSYSVAKYGPQCGTDQQFNPDAGNGKVPGTCNNNPPTFLTADPNDAYVPLLDDPSQT